MSERLAPTRRPGARKEPCQHDPWSRPSTGCRLGAAHRASRRPMTDSVADDRHAGEEKAGAGLPWEAFGTYLRAQRQLARLSLRQLAELTRISNPYLSQIERGLHQPSVAVIRSLADALDLSAEDLLAQAAGLVDRPDARCRRRRPSAMTDVSTRPRSGRFSPSTPRWWGRRSRTTGNRGPGVGQVHTNPATTCP